MFLDSSLNIISSKNLSTPSVWRYLRYIDWIWLFLNHWGQLRIYLLTWGICWYLKSLTVFLVNIVQIMHIDLGWLTSNRLLTYFCLNYLCYYGRLYKILLVSEYVLFLLVLNFPFVGQLGMRLAKLSVTQIS